MAWVKAEYAGELAVVAAWIAALTPWSLTFNPNAPLGSYLFVARFPLGELQVRIPTEITADGTVVGRADAVLAETYPGFEIIGPVFVTDPVRAAAFYSQPALVRGSVVWAVGAVVVLVALGLSIWLYRDESGVRDRLPFDEVRTMGVLLGLVALLFVIATAFYVQARATVGIPVPIGVLVVGLLAVVLLRVDRV